MQITEEHLITYGLIGLGIVLLFSTLSASSPGSAGSSLIDDVGATIKTGIENTSYQAGNTAGDATGEAIGGGISGLIPGLIDGVYTGASSYDNTHPWAANIDNNVASGWNEVVSWF